MTEVLVAVVGTDATMVNDRVLAVVAEVLDGLDPSLALEDLVAGGGSDDEATGAQRALEALHTPPFLVPRRVVVVREAQALSDDEVERLVTWATNPVEGNTLVVALLGGRGKSRLRGAATRVEDVTVGSRPADRLSYVAATLERHDVRANATVTRLIADRLGDDVARADSLARTLRAVFGGASVTAEGVAPYLGEAGDVPEWDLTGAIDEGDAAKAIATLQRMLGVSARSGLQIVNVLQRHYLRIARLDGAGATTGEEAAAIVGGHKYPAEKQMQTARRLGPDRIARAVELVARADHDLKGGASYGAGDGDQTDQVVTEVLVARLARMSQTAKRA